MVRPELVRAFDDACFVVEQEGAAELQRTLLSVASNHSAGGMLLSSMHLQAIDDVAANARRQRRRSEPVPGAFYRSAMHGLCRYLDRKLVRWARRKYKTLRRHKRRGEEWLQKMKEAQPRLFEHWQFRGAKVG